MHILGPAITKRQKGTSSFLYFNTLGNDSMILLLHVGPHKKAPILSDLNRSIPSLHGAPKIEKFHENK